MKTKLFLTTWFAAVAFASQSQSAPQMTVPMANDEIEQVGIDVEIAGAGQLTSELTFPGEIKVNADKMAHIVPRLTGVVRQVHKTLGDDVAPGEVMLTLESRELADAKATYLAARERASLRRELYLREQALWEKKISSEQEYLMAKQAYAEAQIDQRAATQKLRALGLSVEYIEALPGMPEGSLTAYEIMAPFEGTVINRDIVVGEVVSADQLVFTIADLGTVWVDISIYQKDLPHVQPGDRVSISGGPGEPTVEGVIGYVGPVLGEQTRTALARMEIPNDDGQWRPGLFVTARVFSENMAGTVVVPTTAVQNVDDQPCVFIRTDDGFAVRFVTLGRQTRNHVEVLSGLTVGEPYAVNQTFVIKAELGLGAEG